jgi:hypothetical protein
MAKSCSGRFWDQERLLFMIILLTVLLVIYDGILFQYYYDSMSALKQVLVKDLNRDHLRSKKRGIENPTVG